MIMSNRFLQRLNPALIFYESRRPNVRPSLDARQKFRMAYSFSSRSVGKAAQLFG